MKVPLSLAAAAALKQLIIAGRLTKPQLQEQTGLSATSIFRAVSELSELGVIAGDGEAKGELGRPPEFLKPVGLCVLALSVEDRGSKIALMDSTLKNVIISEPMPELESYAVARRAYVSAIADLKAEAAKRYKFVLGTGVSFAGSVDPLSRSLLHPSRFPGWETQDLARDLTEDTGLLTTLDNDATSLVRAFLWFSGTEFEKNFVLVKADRGIGLGVSLNGEPYVGHGNVSRALAHTAVNEVSGRECHCGRYGCLETVSSIPAIVEQAIEEGFNPRRRHSSTAALDAILENGSPSLRLKLANAGRALAQNSDTFARCIDISTVIFTGDLVSKSVDVQEGIIEVMRDEARIGASPNFIIDPEKILPSNEMGLIGASANAFDLIPQNRTLYKLN